MITAGADVDSRDALTVDEFYNVYVNKKPVVIRGALKDLRAVSTWSTAYLRSLGADLPVRIKIGNLAEGATRTQTLAQYCDLIDDIAGRTNAGERLTEPPPYLHDLPLLTLLPALRDDLEPFPAHLFPRFFRSQWWAFTQSFVGPPQATTPLHFDTLKTHNLFFQIHGKKRFVLVPAEDRQYCYTYNWRWARVDPDAPRIEEFPLFSKVRVSDCVIQGGDILYMPPGTLHQVTSLSTSISFNIDWHDKRSALRGITAVAQGMPIRNLQYNAAFAAGVIGRIPYPWLKPLLDSYFYYIS